MCETWLLFLEDCWSAEEAAQLTRVYFPEAPGEEAETASDPRSCVKCNNLQASYWATDSRSVGLMSLSGRTTTDKSGSLNTMTHTLHQYGSSQQTDVSGTQKPAH